MAGLCSARGHPRELTKRSNADRGSPPHAMAQAMNLATSERRFAVCPSAASLPIDKKRHAPRWSRWKGLHGGLDSSTERAYTNSSGSLFWMFADRAARAIERRISGEDWLFRQPATMELV